MFIDTHAHIYLDQFKDDLEEVIDRSRVENVERIYMPNIDSSSIDHMIDVVERFPSECLPMMGLHPCSIKKGFEKELHGIEDWFSRRHFVAVGEIGTDLYWDKTMWDEQQEALNIQLGWAVKYQVPAVLHTRNSINETIEIVSKFNDDSLFGIFHCFSGTVEQARSIIDLGFYLGIGGLATFKNGGIIEVLLKIPLDKLVLETDSPYLSPTPFRGKRNEPSRIPLIAQKISELKGIDIEEVARITSATADKIFRYESV